MNRLYWAAGLLAAYSTAIQLGIQVADEHLEADPNDLPVGDGAGEEAQTGEAEATETGDGNDVNINIAFDVKSRGGHGSHSHPHDASASEQAALQAIASAQAALDAALAGEGADAGEDADAEEEPVLEHVHITLDDDFEIDGTRWADLRSTAMAEGFQETEEFASYSAEDRAIISAFIEAQTAAGEGVPLSSTDEIEITYVDEPLVLPEPVIDPKSHTLIIFPDDANVLLAFGDTWSDIKTDAMAFGYFEQPTIAVLPNFE